MCHRTCPTHKSTLPAHPSLQAGKTAAAAGGKKAAAGSKRKQPAKAEAGEEGEEQAAEEQAAAAAPKWGSVKVHADEPGAFNGPVCEPCLLSGTVLEMQQQGC